MKIKLKSNNNSIGRLVTSPYNSKLGWNIAIMVPFKNITKSMLKPGFVYDVIEINGAVFLQELGESSNIEDFNNMVQNQSSLLIEEEIKQFENE